MKKAKIKKQAPAASGKEVTEIICIIDRSGSMQSIQSDAIGAFNRFLADQQKPDDPARLTMVLFDDQYDIVHNGVAIKDVPPLTEQTFVPRGSTALLDAIGRTLNTVSARLAEIPAQDRPDNVIVAILTDGQENASREFPLAAIQQMIDRYTTELAWDFIYLAATQDAFQDAGRIGIAAANTMQFSADAYGIENCCSSISEAVAMKRKMKQIIDWKKDHKDLEDRFP